LRQKSLKAKTLDLTMTSLNGALYATLGYMTFLGLFAPVVGVVRFWPGVFVPAVFAVLFGPIVGGVGASIGIFISDMLVHGNALLSLTVGVPANFVMFSLIGLLANRKSKPAWRYISTLVSLSILLFLLGLSYFLPWEGGEAFVWLGVAAISTAAILILSLAWPRWSGYQVAASVGNAVGSTIVGFGVWAFSQFLIVPGGGQNLSVISAYILTVFTFMNQIPFLLIVVPPVLKASYRAFPALVRRVEEEG